MLDEKLCEELERDEELEECTPEEWFPSRTDCSRREWDCLHPPTRAQARACLDRQPVERDPYTEDFSIPECDRIRACDRRYFD